MRFARFFVIVSLVVGSMAVGANPAAGQAVRATLNVSPAAVIAGNPVAVSGTCVDGGDAHVGAHTDDDAYGGNLDLKVQSDRSFSGSFPIPREAVSATWRFFVLCLDGDAVYGNASQNVAVTATNPVPIAVNVHPGATANATTISGSGCVADGRPLSEITLSVGALPDDSQGYLADERAMTAQNGTWSKTFTLRRAFVGDAQAVVDCTNSNNPSVTRRMIVAFSVGPARPAQRLTDPRVTQRPKIARTGAASPSWLLPLGLALLACGYLLRTSSRVGIRRVG